MHRLRLPSRDFVPVEPIGADRHGAAPAATAEPVEPATPFLPADAGDAWTGRTSLFGDAER